MFPGERKTLLAQTGELGRTALDICVPDTEIFDMPMELGLELMTFNSADLADPEWQLVDDVIDKVDRA